MKATQVSPWLQMADAFQTLAAGFVKVDAVEKNGGFKLPTIQALPAVNGKTNGHTNGHANGNGNGHHAAAKALPSPQKVKKAVKALPAAPEATKAKAKPAKETKAIVKAKAKKEPKAKKAAAASSPAIAAGRRAVADGLRPKLRDAIVIVMGTDTLGAGEVLERLNARGWSPGAANPQSYISYALTEHLKDGTFKRVDRGTYVVKNPAQFADVVAQWGGKATKAKAAPAAAAPAKKATKKAGGKTSKKAEGVASTDAGVVEAAATEAPEAAPVVTAEAAPTAGDPQISTPQNEESAAPPVAADSAVAPPSTDSTDAALKQLGIGADGVGDNPFEALA